MSEFVSSYPTPTEAIAIGRKFLLNACRHGGNNRCKTQQHLLYEIARRQGGLGFGGATRFLMDETGKPLPLDDRLSIRFYEAVANIPVSWNEYGRKIPLVLRTARDGRGCFQFKDGIAIISDGRRLDTMLHEYIHFLQHIMSWLDEYFQNYHRSLDLLPAIQLPPPYKIGELAECLLADGSLAYVRPYFGKVYPPNNEPLEVMTMSFQALLGSNDRLFFKFIREDEELASLTLGLLLSFRP